MATLLSRALLRRKRESGEWMGWGKACPLNFLAFPFFSPRNLAR